MINYQQEVCRLIENFQALNITTIPRSKNTLVDSLDTIASSLSPLEDYETSRFTIELLYNPPVLDNITNRRVVEGDEQIISFLTNEKKIENWLLMMRFFKKI
jgi:hypothetical protein